MEKREEIPTVASLKWYQKITVEPTMFLYMMAFMLTSVVEQAFFMHKACTVNHNYSADFCSNLDSNDTIKKEIQITVSTFHQWNNIAGHVVPIVLALFLGSWSDKRGRKLPLILGLVGKLIYSVMVIVNATQSTWPLEYVIYTASIPGALTGSDVAVFASAFAYISDVSSVKDRTIRITILDVCYLSTMPIGVALGSYLYTYVVNESFVLMFTINAVCLLVAIIYSLIHLQWKTNPKQRSITEVGCCGLIPDFFDKEHIIEAVKTMTKKRRMNRRAYLWIFMIAMLFYTFQRDEKQMTYLYTQLKFKWNTVDFSNFKTFQSTAYVIMMLCGIPIMSKWLHFKDTTIGMVGATAHIIARIVFASAQAPFMFFIGGGISGLGPVVGPILRSMTSKVVPLTERGKVFALLSVCDNAVPFFSAILYTQVYNATVGVVPGIYFLTIATQVIVFFLFLTVHITLRGRPLEVSETGPESSIAMIGAAAHALARIFFGLAESSFVFYIGGFVSSFGPIAGPVLRSMTSKIVKSNERGKAFVMLSLCSNAVPFISSILYTQIFNATVGSTAGIFWLTLATQLIVFVLMLFVHITKPDAEVDEKDDPKFDENIKLNEITNLKK